MQEPGKLFPEKPSADEELVEPEPHKGPGPVDNEGTPMRGLRLEAVRRAAKPSQSSHQLPSLTQQ